MTIITRYVLKEHVAPFFSGVATITFLFLLNLVFRELGRLLGKGLPAMVIIEFFLLNLAWIIAIAVPMGVLVATLMAFGRFSSDSEISALKASGVHLYRLIAPLLAVGALLMVGMERFNNCVLPDFNFRVRQLSRDISRTRPTLTMEPNVFFDDIPNYSLLVQKIDDEQSRLFGIIINDHSDPKRKKTVIAESGSVSFSAERELMVLSLQNGEVHEVDVDDLRNYRRLKFQQQIISIPVPNMVLKRSESQTRTDREKSAEVMLRDVQSNRSMIADRRRRIEQVVDEDFKKVLSGIGWAKPETTPAVDAQQPEDPRNADRIIEQTHKQIQGINRILREYIRSTNSLLVEIHKKYSIPVACVIFVLVGVPLGIMSHQGGFAVAGGFSLVFYMLYWTFMIGGEQLADRSLVDPAAAMWAPNVIVGILGIYLVIQSVKESTVIHWDQLGSVFKEWMKTRRQG